MRILVTGGTGFIGRSLTRHLQRFGHELFVLSRNPEAVRQRFGGTVSAIPSIASLDATQHFNCIVNLAGEPIFGRRWSPERKRILNDSRIGLTDQLCGFIDRATAKPDVLLSGSAIGFYGDQADRLLDESSPARDDYSHRLCAEWEASADRARDWGVRVCTLRTGLVLGPGGGLLQRMVPPFRLGLGGRLGSGRQWMSWIHLDDHVRAMTTLIEANSLSGTFNLTAPNPVTNAEFTATLARRLRRPALLPLPARLLRLLFGEMADLLLASQRVIPQRLNDAGFQFLYPTLDSALADALRSG